MLRQTAIEFFNEDGIIDTGDVFGFVTAAAPQLVTGVFLGGSTVAFQMVVPMPLLIEKVEWVATADSPLSINPNPGGGLAIFPDKTSTNDTKTRNTVQVRVTLNQQLPNVQILVHLVDVDDPSSSAAPVDDERKTSDNRDGSDIVHTLVRTDAKGIALATFEVSPQPGDNYRVFAKFLPDRIKLEVPQKDGTAARILDNGKPIPTTPGRVVAAPDLLTVWRRLHVEVDSMGAVTGNTVKGNITNVVAGATPGTSVVTTDQTLKDSVDRFEKGQLIDSKGDVFTVVANKTGANFQLTVQNNSTTGKPPALGKFELYDDDELEDGDDVPEPDTSDLQNAMLEAYILVFVNDVGDRNNNVPFDQNVDSATEHKQIVAANWTSRKDNSPMFWVAYILGAFQGPQAEDRDPNSEGATATGTTFGQTGNPGGGSLIYLEVIRDGAPARSNPDVGANIRDTVVHEVGHAVANNGKHPVTGADAVDSNLAKGATSPDGIFVDHLDYSRYQPAYIAWIRSTKKPRS